MLIDGESQLKLLRPGAHRFTLITRAKQATPLPASSTLNSARRGCPAQESATKAMYSMSNLVIALLIGGGIGGGMGNYGSGGLGLAGSGIAGGLGLGGAGGFGSSSNVDLNTNNNMSGGLGGLGSSQSKRVGSRNGSVSGLGRHKF